MGKICLPIALEQNDIAKLDEVVKRNRVLHKGEHVFHMGDPFTSVFAVRSGCVKTYQVMDNGDEQVNGFYFPGEVMGLDGLSNQTYASSAVALEVTSVCEIPFAKFRQLTQQLPELQMHFMQLMSQEITAEQQLITLLSKKTAEQRVATLLLTISERNANRNMSASRFRLSMSRIDIGNYLGLTVETVSRMLSRFVKSKVITIERKEIQILDQEALLQAASLDHLPNGLSHRAISRCMC